MRGKLSERELINQFGDNPSAARWDKKGMAMNKRTRKLVIGGLMVGVAGLILGAGLAKAEPMTVDGHYLLNMHMGKVPGSDAQLVALGHTACAELGYGLSPYQVGQYLTQMDLQLSMMDTADVVGTATVTYCPQFASEPPMGYPDVGGQPKVFSLGPPRTSPNDTGLPVTPPQTSTPWEGVPQLPGPPRRYR